MRPVLWGLLFSAIGFIGWIFFSFLFAIAKITGGGNTTGVFFLVTFGLLGFFSLPIGAVFDLARKRQKLRYLAYVLIAIAALSWIGSLSAGIKEETAYKPIKIRAINIVKEGQYSGSVLVSSVPPPLAQYGEFKVDVSVAYFKPLGGSDHVTVQNVYVLTNGFELKHVEPSLPFSVSDSAVAFTVTIKGPREGFDGPLTLKIVLSN